MLLATAPGNFNEVFFQQTDGMSQNGSGDKNVIVKGKLADRLPRRQLDGGHGFAERDQGRCFHPLNQLSEDAVDGCDLGFTEPTNIGQEQVRHLPENLGIVLRSTLFGAVQFRAQIRRYRRHGYPAPVRTVPARRNAPGSGHSIVRMAGIFVDPPAAEGTSM
ncbi:hypothetical protein [Bradyrhizobium sp. CSA112]|uniref:hypothetical protein n=1 Tax=Bradyrhizobium sp. CSA112 TaxID=2699170 RepID=UPI0023AF82E8|nr:hypothetical protein [Bradyrhizobium sp. CSA112]